MKHTENTKMAHNLHEFVDEASIRYACREKYAAVGSLDNPYPDLTLESLAWNLEAARIRKEIGEAA